jgi:dTDP-4-amino-4,6-dideoxygalactose transaminase
MYIPFNDLTIKNKKGYIKIFKKFLDSGKFVNHENVKKFENQFSKKFDFKFGIGCNSGTDAIEISLRFFKKKNNEAAITVSHTATATVSAIMRAGVTPIFCDIEKDFNTMCPISLEKTIKVCLKKNINIKYIVPVHIYGQLCDMKKINNISKKYNLNVIEDCSQSHGAKFLKNKKENKNLSIFSLYPTKNLGALGDAGIICTNNKKIYKKLKSLTEYGWQKRICKDDRGINSRLDEIQASLLLYKLKSFNKYFIKRQTIANRYLKIIKNSKIKLPLIRQNTLHSFHLFVVEVNQRNNFINFLKKEKIGTSIHYNKPLHKHDAYLNILKFDKLQNTENLSNRIVSLPLNDNLSIKNSLKIANKVNKFK